MKLLFICTHNRCRSILAEAISNHLSNGQIIAVSAGSSPEGEVHPSSLKYLAERNIPTKGLNSQSWNSYEDFHADAILTMCDNAAAETCPVWFDHSVQVHWGIADPSKAGNDHTKEREAFIRTIELLEQRITLLLGNDLTQLRGADLKTTLSNIASQIH